MVIIRSDFWRHNAKGISPLTKTFLFLFCRTSHVCVGLTFLPSLLYPFTVTTGADTDRRPTDQPHSTQFPVLTAVAQFDCTGTDSLFTV
jgi:hypothetical protein